jgi:hypothetical protein
MSFVEHFSKTAASTRTSCSRAIWPFRRNSRVTGPSTSFRANWRLGCGAFRLDFEEGLGGEAEETALFLPVMRQVLAQSQEARRRQLDGMPACEDSANNFRREVESRLRRLVGTCSFRGVRSSPRCCPAQTRQSRTTLRAIGPREGRENTLAKACQLSGRPSRRPRFP